MPVADKNNSFATAKNLGRFTESSVTESPRGSAFSDIGFLFKQGNKSSLDKQAEILRHSQQGVALGAKI